MYENLSLIVMWRNLYNEGQFFVVYENVPFFKYHKKERIKIGTTVHTEVSHIKQQV